MAKIPSKKAAKKAPYKPSVPALPPDAFRLHTPVPDVVQVKHADSPRRVPRRERIHPRRILPRVKEGRERDFHSSTRELIFHPPSLGVRAAGDDLVVLTNSELTGPAQQQLASNVGEPSVAAAGNVVFYTGNWYAARSADGGQTFQYLDPFTAFPDPPNLGYCCDQVVQYIPSIDTFVWLLQYGPKTGPEADNIQRLAFATSAGVVSGMWTLFDITTKALGVPGVFLDFPDLAVGANFLYVTTNMFGPAGNSAGAAVLRIPIASIASGKVTAQKFLSSSLNSFRVAQNCGTRAFFAAHQDTSTLSVFTWDEGQPQPVSSSAEVARWITGNGYQSRTPDGRSWLDRADPRITGATLAGSELYFAWSVDANSNHRPKPFVQIARIDSQNLTLLENINIFDPDSATCYGALATNADNEVGISYMIGGGPLFPSHVVGLLTGTRRDVVATAGERGPLPDPSTGKGEWGDFLTVRPLFPARKLFAAAGYVMKGSGDGSNRDTTPHFVVFGRAGNTSSVPAPAGPIPATAPPAPPVPAAPLPPTPQADGDPITDVNTLPVVSPSVAAIIKVAAGLNPAHPQAFEREETMESQPEADKPGTERWPVKTGQDLDRAKVGKNVINGVDLQPGIVDATLEELISLPRPPGLEVATQDPPAFRNVRDGVTEVTIWRIEAKILALKHEADGDYHLVLQGTSGQEMVGEIPTPTTVFVGDSPWIDNIGQARSEVDDKIVKHLSPASFALLGDKYVPHGAMAMDPRASADPRMCMTTPPKDSGLIQPLFQTAVTPTAARITGVGFFDRAHGATGAAPNVIELHPVLKIEWL